MTMRVVPQGSPVRLIQLGSSGEITEKRVELDKDYRFRDDRRVRETHPQYKALEEGEWGFHVGPAFTLDPAFAEGVMAVERSLVKT
jgi:hypothetical protein